MLVYKILLCVISLKYVVAAVFNGSCIIVSGNSQKITLIKYQNSICLQGIHGVLFVQGPGIFTGPGNSLGGPDF